MHAHSIFTMPLLSSQGGSSVDPRARTCGLALPWACPAPLSPRTVRLATRTNLPGPGWVAQLHRPNTERMLCRSVEYLSSSSSSCRSFRGVLPGQNQAHVREGTPLPAITTLVDVCQPASSRPSGVLSACSLPVRPGQSEGHAAEKRCGSPSPQRTVPLRRGLEPECESAPAMGHGLLASAAAGYPSPDYSRGMYFARSARPSALLIWPRFIMARTRSMSRAVGAWDGSGRDNWPVLCVALRPICYPRSRLAVRLTP